MNTDIDTVLSQQDRSLRSDATGFLQRVYAWMSGGMLITGATAAVVLSNEELLATTAGSLMLLLLAELGIVMWLSAAINRLNPVTAKVLFSVYAAMNGLTLAPLVFLYTAESVTNVFLACAVMFGATSVYGLVTKKDLSGMGGFFTMGLFGLIGASVVNLFLGSTALEFAISLVGVVVFLGLTAYDNQKIKELYAVESAEGAIASNISILAALTLYLDFINLFLFLLRLLGRRK
ncbi:MAG: Bax inhibitor-1/YccA family protein [Candidatus Kapaibacterium sp.]